MVSVNGGPNRAIQVDMNALHTDMDVISANGTASNHLVHESVNVSNYLGLLFPSAAPMDPLYPYGRLRIAASELASLLVVA